MKKFASLTILILSVTAVAAIANEELAISGTVRYSGADTGKIAVSLYRLRVTASGKPIPLGKSDIYGASIPVQTNTLTQSGPYSFNGLSEGYYSVLAFLDGNGDGQVSFDSPEPFGWHTRGTLGVAAINLAEDNATGIDITLRKPTPFPDGERKTDHGTLRRIKGIPVLQLWGTAEERGFAHGYLVGPQIIDFFEFYVIEDSWRSVTRYEEIFVPFLKKNFNYPPEYLRECDAVIAGMKTAGINMFVELLGRDFTRTDLLAMNSYIERRAAYPVERRSSCTQFAFWGAQTQGSDLNGGLIAGRNMDGECDVRKVTVSHFLLFAIEPSEPGHKRWISAMWPGFVGTISGVNEDGLYSMENAGGTGPGQVVGGIVPCSWTQRYVLETAGSNATPESVLSIMSRFACEGGGITAPGSVILWAVPNNGQQHPAFVYEGDRFGGAMRLPSNVRPLADTNIMASNHYLVYGYDQDKPGYCFGLPVSFSSLWRYEAGMNTVEAWAREGRPIGLDEVKRLLQTVAHGTTEYAVIFLPNEKRIFVAVDDLKTDMWDAPYMPWMEFNFSELFKR